MTSAWVRGAVWLEAGPGDAGDGGVGRADSTVEKLGICKLTSDGEPPPAVSACMRPEDFPPCWSRLDHVLKQPVRRRQRGPLPNERVALALG